MMLQSLDLIRVSRTEWEERETTLSTLRFIIHSLNETLN